jgi:hypothetical protein
LPVESPEIFELPRYVLALVTEWLERPFKRYFQSLVFQADATRVFRDEYNIHEAVSAATPAEIPTTFPMLFSFI